MFIQIHMLQSQPPGNLNRDETGQPKKCLFGGVTRARISSQCLKRTIRQSPVFKDEFGTDVAVRTLYLPRLVADAIKSDAAGIPEEEIPEFTAALAAQFKKEASKSVPDEDSEDQEETSGSTPREKTDKTAQLVFFPPPFARRIAELTAEFRAKDAPAYNLFLGRKPKSKSPKGEDKQAKDAEEKRQKKAIEQFVEEVSTASKSLTVDIGLFGRMTTSDLVVNVEATCQVAHAISTHEVMIEGDYFTALDDLKSDFAETQSEKAGAAYLGSGESVTYFASSVYYKYLNVDLASLRKHLPSLSPADAAHVVATLLKAATESNPSGKQNAFASHGANELVLVEISESKCPLSYANAFLEPVTGPNLMKESACCLTQYIESVAPAFLPTDTHRLLLAVGNAASTELRVQHERLPKLQDMAEKLSKWIEDHKN